MKRIALAPVALSVFSGPGIAAPQDEDSGVRLCVVVVVDQMIPEQLERLAPWLDGGLGRLAREGLVFRCAQLAHGLTSTAPGHTSVTTGVWPSRHGIVGNAWFDRAQDRSVYCYEDLEATWLTDEGVMTESNRYRRSPALCEARGIAEFVRAAHPESKSVTIAAKDRAAVGLGGTGNQLALWWDSQVGHGFSSSTYYTEALPAWVADWNAGWRERTWAHVWDRVTDDPLEGSGTAADEREGEYRIFGWQRTMPHVLISKPEVPEGAPIPPLAIARLARQVYETPVCDTYVTELVLRALDELELGRDDALDYLGIGYTAVDTVGHLFGPYSVEVTDAILRLDRHLGTVLAALDEKVGAGRYVLALTADHGVMELPEHLVARRQVGAVRVPARDLLADARALDEHLFAEFGERLVMRRNLEGIYLNQTRMGELSLDAAAVRESARAWLVANATWLARAYTQEEVLSAKASGTEDPWLELCARSHFADRSPDVFCHAKPWHLLGEASGTTHGSPYDYDRRIPLVFFGPRFEPRSSFDDASSCDVLPTLLEAAGAAVPEGLDGESRL